MQKSRNAGLVFLCCVFGKELVLFVVVFVLAAKRMVVVLRTGGEKKRRTRGKDKDSRGIGMEERGP